MVDNRVPIVNPDGVEGSIERDELQKALGKGYSLPMPKLQASDFSEDKKLVNVYNPQGELGTISVDELNKAVSKGYTPQSFVKPEEVKAHQEMVTKSLAAINNHDELYKLHGSDKSMDTDGNLLLKTLDGQEFSLPMQQAIPLLASRQVKFADPNFAALVDASKEQFKQTGEASTAIGKFGKAVIPESVGSYLEGKTGDNISHAAFLAHRISDAEDNYPTAAAIGTGVGLAASLFSPEVLVGAKLGKATEAAIIAGRTEASLGRTLLAKGAGAAVEGAAIVSPQAAAQALIDKNPKAAVETLALGAGLNTILKGAGALVGTGVKAIEKGRLSNAFEEITGADSKIAKLGTATEQEGFLRALGEKGLAEKGAAGKTEETLSKMASGAELSSVATKLEAKADQISADALNTRLQEMSQKVSVVTEQAPTKEINSLNEAVASFSEKTAEQITKLADKEGNISLPQAVSLAENISKHELPEAIAPLQKEFHNEVMQQIFKAGDSATTLENVDAKTIAEWSQAKYNQQVSSEMLKPDFVSRVQTQLPTTEMKGGLAATIVDKALHYVSHQGVHLAAGAAGLAHGGPIMGALTYGASYLVGKGIGKAKDALLESYVSNPKNSTKLAGWLGKQSTNEALGSYLMMDSIHVLQNKLDNIGNQLRVGAVKTATQPNAIKDLLGSSVNGLSKQQQFTRLSDHLAAAISQPDMTHNSIQTLSQTLSHHAEIAQQYEGHMMNKMQYLYQILPKDPTGKQPFTKNEKWQPSPTELAHFQRQLELAQDPFHIIELVKNNTITNKDVATLSTLNPEILNLMRAEINKIAYSGKMDLPYQTKLSLSVLMGESMVASLNNIPVNQSVYGPTQNASSPVPQGMPTPKQGGKGGSNIKAENVSQMTASQRIMGK